MTAGLKFTVVVKGKAPFQFELQPLEIKDPFVTEFSKVGVLTGALIWLFIGELNLTGELGVGRGATGVGGRASPASM